jgi:hypothetical protein
MPTLEIIGIGLGVLILMYLYGQIKHSEGLSRGITLGIVSGASMLFCVFRDAKVVDQDGTGNVYRLNDEGNRDAVVIDAVTAPDMTRRLKNLKITK